MRDVLDSLEKWRARGEEIAVATVVNTWGSAPRPIGSKLITTRSGGIAGSVSAGCVENAVIEEGLAVIQSGEPRLLSFGVADEDAWEVGLACGGSIQVFVEPFSAFSGVYDSLKRRIEAREPMAVVTMLDASAGQRNRKFIVLPDGSREGDLDLGEHAPRAASAALDLMARETGGVVELEGGPTLFVEVYPPVPRLIVVGAVHMAEPLVTIANALGFDTIIVDPRTAFATRERFPDAKQLIQEWPQHALPKLALDNWAYVAVLTHDPKLDDPALKVALTSGARYVGALGSRRTHRLRVERLREAGLTEEQIARLHAPIGLPLSGHSPAEIALSIMAEITQVRHGEPAQLSATA